eukprot:3079115-Pyramimonas_sp.AAC.3
MLLRFYVHVEANSMRAAGTCTMYPQVLHTSAIIVASSGMTRRHSILPPPVLTRDNQRSLF